MEEKQRHRAAPGEESGPRPGRQAPFCWAFDGFRLDPHDERLWRGVAVLPLPPKPFAVLCCLVAQAGHLVSKEALLEVVWPETSVREAVLHVAIGQLRQVLGDQASAPRLIETVHGRGYRFIAPVHSLPVAAGPAASAAPPLPLPRDVAPGAKQALPPSADPPVAVSPRATEDQTPERLPATSDTSDTTAPLPDGEYKLVTVLCGAVADTSAPAARLGPEARYRLMQTVFELAQEVVQAYEGTLLHYASEGFTAVFGAPVAQEDHTRRAVLAALELHHRLGVHPSLHVQPLANGLALRMGVHSGRVVGGSLGQEPQRLYTVVGEATALATRLQQQATPGTILLSAATAVLVQAEVHVTPGGTLALDGGEPPVSVYVVQGLLQRQAGVVGQAPRVWSPFVGRTHEVALLHDRLDTVRTGQGHVVGIVGEPGMGKTRLLTEFCQSLAGQPVTVYTGQCLAYEQTTPYLPARDVLRQLCALMDGDPVETRTAAVQQRLGESGIHMEEDVTLVSQLLDLPSAPECLARLSPEARRARTFALLRHLVFDTAQRQPLILVVENLHWSDPTSEAWLASLVEQLAGAAVLLLVTFRPGYQPSWSTHSAATQVALSPLRAYDSQTVAKAVLGPVALPAVRLQALITRAAGNPFFVEELAWHAREQDQEEPPGVVPATIHAVLAARLDRLPPEDKRLLQIAAVIGMAVPCSLLRAIAGEPEERLQQHLTHLQAAEFLYETRCIPDLTYTFKHALTQEVAYGSLFQEGRRALHATIVDAIEGLYPDRVAEQVERLAQHAARGEVWEKARTYCRQAGRKALARTAYREAVMCFEQALEALRHLPEQRDMLEQAIDLRFDLRNALLPLGESKQILDHLRQAEVLAEALSDQRRLGQTAGYMASLLRELGDLEGSLASAERALAIATALGDVGLRVATNVFLGEVYFWVLSDYQRATEVFRRNVEILNGTPLRERFGTAAIQSVYSRAYLVYCLAELGAFAEGWAHAEDALRLAEEVEHPYSLTIACAAVGYFYLRQGSPHQAIRVLERGLALSEAMALLPMIDRCKRRLSTAYAMAGRIPEALSLLERLLEKHIAMGLPCLDLSSLIRQGEVYMLAGRVVEARSLGQRALEIARAPKQQGYQAYALRLLGESAAQWDPPEHAAAEAHYRQALSLAEELGMRPLVAHCHLGLGTLHATTGQWEQARRALVTAIAMYQAMDMTFWLPQAEAALTAVGGVCNAGTSSVASAREGMHLAARE